MRGLSIFTPAPLVRAEVALYRPRRAAVLLHPAGGRWPDHEAADRLAIGIGMAALAAHQLPQPRWDAYRDLLEAVATRVAAAGAGPLPGDLVPLERLGLSGALAVVAWEGDGAGRVEAALLGTRGGLVPKLLDAPREPGPLKEIAALALLVALAADADGDGRLALALSVEGLLAWFRESDRMSAPRNVLLFALSHAGGRLREAGRALPAGL